MILLGLLRFARAADPAIARTAQGLLPPPEHPDSLQYGSRNRHWMCTHGFEVQSKTSVVRGQIAIVPITHYISKLTTFCLIPDSKSEGFEFLLFMLPFRIGDWIV